MENLNARLTGEHTKQLIFLIENSESRNPKKSIWHIKWNDIVAHPMNSIVHVWPKPFVFVEQMDNILKIDNVTKFTFHNFSTPNCKIRACAMWLCTVLAFLHIFDFHKRCLSSAKEIVCFFLEIIFVALLLIFFDFFLVVLRF